MKIQFAKDKCSLCGKDRVYYKSVPMACECQYKNQRITNDQWVTNVLKKDYENKRKFYK
jgi:hypothetical protein